MINITFPDGAVREFESGVTTFEIAQSISNSLAKKSWLVNSTANWLILLVQSLKMVALKSWHLITKMPFQSCVTQLLTCSPKQLVVFSQTFTWEFGPAIEDGFYYDTDNTAGQISNEDLPRIEEEMQKIVKENFPSIREEVTKDEAREIFKNDPYKLELIEEHSEDEGGLTSIV